MKIVLVSIGSRGDVQPYISLGLALLNKGHDITVATEERLRPLVEEFGLPHARISGDATGLLHETHAQEALIDGSFFKLIKLTNEWDKKFDKQAILDSYIPALSGADLIISGALCMTESYTVAQLIKAAWLPMILGPTYPTSEFPLMMLSFLALSSCMNKWTYNIAFSSLASNEAKYITPWRKRLNLPPINKNGIMGVIDTLHPPVLISSCPALTPIGRVPSDYPPNVHMEGVVFLKSSQEIVHDPKLVHFLSRTSTTTNDNRPIIYLGFGSMPAPKGPISLLQIAIEVCEICHCRAVLVLGWNSNNNKPTTTTTTATTTTSPLPTTATTTNTTTTTESPYISKSIPRSDFETLLKPYEDSYTLCVIPSVSHEWLFPQMSCVIHHCGIGTTYASLRSGVPQVPCTFYLDQPYNAKMLLREGVATDNVPFTRSFNAKKLALAINKILIPSTLSETYKQKAKEWKKIIEDCSQNTLENYCNIAINYAEQRLKELRT